MRFRGTAVLFLVFIILGSWVYWTEIRGRAGRERLEDAAGRALPVEALEITELRLIYPDRSVSAKRSDDRWVFVSPEGLEADNDLWEQLAASVTRIEKGQTLLSEPGDAALYGLDDPPLRIEVRLTDGREEEIRFGSDNPSGSSSYASLASETDVFLTPNDWHGLFDKHADDLRDKTLLRFEPSGIERIGLSPTGIALFRDDGVWYLDGSPRLRADDGEVASFLSELRSARATGFAAPGVQPALDSAEVVLNDMDGVHMLSFGRMVPGSADQVYVRDPARPSVFTAAVSLRDRVLAPSTAWRDRTIAEIEPDTVVSIRIEREGESPLLVSRIVDGWTLSDGRNAVAMRVQEMLGAFDFQKASEVIDAPGPLGRYGLDPPRVRVVMRGESGEEILAFGFGNELESGEVYWKAEDETAIKVVPLRILGSFDVGGEIAVSVEQP